MTQNNMYSEQDSYAANTFMDDIKEDVGILVASFGFIITCALIISFLIRKKVQ